MYDEKLDEVNGYNINREKKVISFGCGAVELKRTEIQFLIDNFKTLKSINEGLSGNIDLGEIVSEFSKKDLKKILGK